MPGGSEQRERLRETERDLYQGRSGNLAGKVKLVDRWMRKVGAKGGQDRDREKERERERKRSVSR